MASRIASAVAAIAVGGCELRRPLDEQVEDLVQQLQGGQLARLRAGLAGLAGWR